MDNIKGQSSPKKPHNIAVLDEFNEFDEDNLENISEEKKNMDLANIGMDINPVLDSTLPSENDCIQYHPNQGFKRYQPALRAVFPSKTKQSEKSVLPFDRVGLLNFITYLWMTKLLWGIYRRGANAVINFKIPILDSSRLTTQRIYYLWQTEIKNKGLEKASLENVASEFVRTRWVLSTALFSLGLASGFVTPVLFLSKLMEFLETPDAPITDGVFYILYIFLVDISRMLIVSLSWTLNIRTGLRIRSAILGLIFEKMVNLKSLGDKNIGELINLFANDGTRIFEYILWGRLWIAGTVTVIVCLGYAFYLLGLPALTSIGVFVFFYCLQIAFAKGIAHFRFKAVKITDKRVRQMTEILNYIKMIKLYAWEDSFLTKITGIRNTERKNLEKMSIIHNVSHPLGLSVPMIAAIATFLVCFALGRNLTSEVVFPVVGALILSRSGVLLLPISAGKVAEYKSSIKRAEGILKMASFEPICCVPENSEHAIQISNGTFAWDAVNFTPETPLKLPQKKSIFRRQKKDPDASGKDTENNVDEQSHLTNNLNSNGLTPVLHNINLTIPHKKLIGVCGKVGSGKSSLINTILGQLNLLEGSVTVSGPCSYVSQQAWIMNTTVSENITFGDNYDEKKFNEVIDCCGLKEDIETFAAGLETEIGERGVNLSGGQKQRISLARAVYSNRDIYLLDDPLSAVDYKVGAHIFKHCIKEALKSKTVILVSHLTYYLDECDYVLVLDEGKIVEEGEPSQLKNASGLYSELAVNLESLQDETEKQTVPIKGNGDSNIIVKDKSEPKEKSVRTNEEIAAGKRITTDEKMERGGIRFDTYNYYIRATGGYIVALLIVLTIGLNIGLIGFSNWWLSAMISQKTLTRHYQNISTHIAPGNSEESFESISFSDLDILIYGCLLAAIFLSILLRAYVYVKGTLRASTELHKKVLVKVIESPMRFFETVPIGRIINIFAKDQDEVDTQLSVVMEAFLNFVWITIISVLMVVLVYPWFLLPLLAFAIIFCFYSSIFQGALRELKRFENVSRSPLFGHISAMAQGLTTIHAYQKEKSFTDKFCKLQDENTVLQMQLQYATRWLAFRLDVLVIILTITTALFMVFWKGYVPAAFAGLALSYSAQMAGLLHFLIRNMAETQARFTNVERIMHYTQTLVHEGSEKTVVATPPKEWPSNGQIIFKNVSMRYRDGLPLALNEISFKIDAGEKIGIVGRTGSGKSSLAVVLFRLVELSDGHIEIDDIDISQISLQNLRQKLSLIPQDPVLFLGTIRYNLDTFQQYTDEAIWDALEKTGLTEKISSMENQLYSPVVENGENFSVGERQLLCLARALLRNSQIIILDEATASVDANTDALVQRILQNAFSHCTIMTIAHRVHTVLNYNKILVLSYGKVLEYDSPSNLRSNPNSVLSMLLTESKQQSK